MDLQLKNKVVLVTGGGTNSIGAAIINACAREGSIAVAMDRDVQAAQQVLGGLSAQRVNTNFIVNVSSPDCEAVVQQTLRSLVTSMQW